ncbi:MAG: hypothetical protein COA71_04790 [SAR86 cluster bacterium]|uniref:FAD dependent oxidoreductase domain-containing protein n=1 Tax=SAR86 cluster bacterium TaxID=2030880 RepID=A0A2A5CH42_9GAMM|nr:MAG: hypothetical protein COA71_04790 [SAR86 cluster bacterium]
MKIIIIGSGLMGVATAYYLSEQGHEVLVVDRQQGPALETSFANAGVLHPSQASPWNHPGIALQVLKWMGKENSPFLLRPRAIPSLLSWGISFLNHAKPNKFQANLHSNTVLANYNIQCMQDLQKQHPFDYSANSLGSMKVLGNEQDMEKELASIPLFESFGVECTVLNQAEIFKKEPALIENGENLIGGVHYPGDQAGDAYQFCIELTELAKKNNVRFEYDVTVQKLISSGHAITSIQTSNGAYTADAYVLAAGSYSPLLANSIKLKLPIKPIKGYSITLDMTGWETKPRMPVIDEEAHVAITPLGNRLRAAGTAELNGYDTEISAQRVQLILDQVISRYPAAESYSNEGDISPWTGLRPTSADGVPILGATSFKNFYLNTGHGHLGWSLAMGSGKLVADLISGQNSAINISPYSLGRF